MINNQYTHNDIQDNCLINYPNGLQKIIKLTIDKYDATYWIINNSDSMGIKDSKITRFQELYYALKFHAKIAQQFNKHLQFHIVNTPNDFTSNIIKPDLDELYRLSQTNTLGNFSLNESINTILMDIDQKITVMNKKIHIVITTDSEPTDTNILNILNGLIEKQFIDITIRLCTDDPRILDYWQIIDELTGYKLNIVNNIYVKTTKILLYNPWLSYCEPIHRVFECGKLIKLFHSLEERTLQVSEIHHFSEYLIDQTLPDPQYNFNQFISTLNFEINKLEMVINPLNKKYSSWINVNKINKFNNWPIIFFAILIFIIFYYIESKI